MAPVVVLLGLAVVVHAGKTNHALNEGVVELLTDGVATADIASEFGCSQRRVQQVAAAVGLAPCEAMPIHPALDDVVVHEAARHGDNYGVEMLLWAPSAPMGAVPGV